MMPAAALLLPVLFLQTSAADSLRLAALRLTESALVIEARARPIGVRDAIHEVFARASADPASADRELETARRLGAAYALAWGDSFHVREVARFASWSAPRRAAKIAADSARRAGNEAYGETGAGAAIRIWRRALARANAIGDSAGMAATHGNLGAGFLAQERLDSAEFHFERARWLAAAIGDTRVEGNALGALGSVDAERGRWGAARERYRRSLALRERIGDTRGMAADYNELGVLARQLGDLDEATRQFERALELNRREGREEVGATNLLNLAGIASLTGDFSRAARLYRDALATWRANEQWAHAADALRGLGQLELRRGDYPAARTKLREAVDAYASSGAPAEALEVRTELADAMAAAGNLQEALEELRVAERAADEQRAPPRVRAGIALSRADLAWQLNTPAEAERLYLKAAALYQEAGDGLGEAEASEGRATLYVSHGDHARARPLLERTAITLDRAGHRRAAALTRIALGQLARKRGEIALARRQLSRAAAELERLGDPVATAAALGERAALEAESGEAAAAESLYRAALARLGDRIAPDIAWQLHAGLGRVLRDRESVDDAARELRAALEELGRPIRSLKLAERRSAYLADKWDVYAELAATERARGRPGAAFEASESLRARQMLELLARGRVESPGGQSDEIVAREQDLRRRIAELTRALDERDGRGSAARGVDLTSARQSVRRQLLRTQDAYAELLLEMRERATRHASLVSHRAAGWRDVALRLGSREAFVEYLIGDSASMAFLITPDTIALVDLPVDRRELARLVDFARGLVERRGAAPSDSLWRAPLRRLHDRLIAPLEATGLLDGKHRLVLVPHAELHYLPFAALLTGSGSGNFLVERYTIAYAPSASVWLALEDRFAPPPARGVLALAPNASALPASLREVAAIERLANATVLIGRDASESAFRRLAERYRVLHLATNGILNKHNPMFSFVELAAAAPDDGRLEVHEVFGLRLAADLVVLSACQTGLASGSLADVPAGDDWVGLVRAFLHAGAHRVVATLWPVDDWATAVLMERFYGSLDAATDPADALARAQRAMLGGSTTAHPYFWAGFVMVGGANERGARGH